MKIDSQNIAMAYIVSPYGYGTKCRNESADINTEHRIDTSDRLLVQTAKHGATYLGKRLSEMNEVAVTFASTLTQCTIHNEDPGLFHARRVSATGSEIKPFLS